MMKTSLLLFAKAHRLHPHLHCSIATAAAVTVPVRIEAAATSRCVRDFDDRYEAATAATVANSAKIETNSTALNQDCSTTRCESVKMAAESAVDADLNDEIAVASVAATAAEAKNLHRPMGQHRP